MSNVLFRNKYRTKSLRLQHYDYSSIGAYFVTIVVKNRCNILGSVENDKMKLNKYGRICFVVWNDLINHYSNIQLDKFVIMPNHIHGIIVINHIDVVDAIHELHLRRWNDDRELHLRRDNNELRLRRWCDNNRIKRRKMLLPKIIGRFKMQTAKQINKLLNLSGQPFWQRNYYERIIRNEDELYRIRKYILHNPRNWNVAENCNTNIP